MGSKLCPSAVPMWQLPPGIFLQCAEENSWFGRRKFLDLGLSACSACSCSSCPHCHLEVGTDPCECRRMTTGLVGIHSPYGKCQGNTALLAGAFSKVGI